MTGLRAAQLGLKHLAKDSLQIELSRAERQLAQVGFVQCLPELQQFAWRTVAILVDPVKITND